MDKSDGPLDVSSDVLHIPAQTKLTPEEIAKAVAHHKRHHPEGRPAAGRKPQQQAPRRKQK